jgi:N-acyl-D-amino-acid deacylase
MLDLKITGARLLDGSGGPAADRDVGVRGDRIAEIGSLADAPARLTLHAPGRLLCPGFIDVHSHSDAYLLLEPAAPSKIFQGVTTEVVGNCGVSAAPLARPEDLPSDWAALPYPGAWRSVAEYADLLIRAKPALNVALLAGHGRLRAAVLGHAGRPATPDEIRAMALRLEQAFDEGVIGLSSGLIYPPGLFAEPPEIHALARVAARRGGLYASHLRSEGQRLLEALDELLDTGRAARVRLQVSHLKTSGRANWGLLDAALDKLRAARDAGLELAADRYPYIASGTDLDAIFPAWAKEGGRAAILNRLRDPDTRRRLREDLLASRPESSWGAIVVGSTAHPDNARFMGRPLDEIAQTLGLEPVDAALRLIETDELRTSAFFFGMSEDNLWRILAEPWVMIGSDASLRAPSGPLSHDHPHPRAYGAFARFLRAALDGRTVPLPEAIRKMTALPADHFRLRDRGRLVPGAFADLALFDPAAVRDAATFAQPHQLAAGLETLVVNGRLVIHQGRPTGDRPGRLLR